MEGNDEGSRKRGHESLSPEMPVAIRKKIRKNRSDSIADEDEWNQLQQLAKKKTNERHPPIAKSQTAKRLILDDENDEEDDSQTQSKQSQKQSNPSFQSPPAGGTKTLFEATTANAEHDKRPHVNKGEEILPPSTRILTEEEMERRRRRRNSKNFQSRRKSLTPNAKAKQYMSDMYSTIIKMSSENKINSKNSWSLHLIDHMEDILVEKNQENNEPDNTDTYNFQKASCTLDASVKIYSYRVDDTWNSSFKVLENLTRGDEVQHNDDDDEGNERRTTSKKLTVANTIESNVKNINMKSVDLEFQVDPLFQKMSQAFDEGGAKGMLMVNLSVHNGCKIVLDSSIVKAAADSTSDTAEVDKKPRKMINISGLTKKLRSSATAVESFDICPKLEHFYDQLKSMNNEFFDKKISVPRLDVQASSHNRRQTLLSQGLLTPRKTPSKTPVKPDYIENTPAPTEVDEDIPQPDFEMGDDGMEYTDEAPQCETPANVKNEDRQSMLPVNGVTTTEEELDVKKPLVFDDEEDEQNNDLLENALLRSIDAEQMDEYSFFDSKTLKNWAGPQHWKVKLPGIRIKRAVKSRKDTTSKPSDEEETVITKKKSRVVGELHFKLSEEQITKALSKPKNKSSLEISTLMLKKNESKAAELVYPVDLHIRIDRFYQLFTRPRTNVMFSSMIRTTPYHVNTPSSQPQYIHDDVENGIDFESGNGDYLNDDDFRVEGLIQADRIVDKIDIQYERFAKRVDVKKLKQSIWETLPFHETNVQVEDDDTTTKSIENSQEKVSFEQLVQQVAPKVPSNVTVSFYFICMLHLANDKGLELVGQEDMLDFKISHDSNV